MPGDDIEPTEEEGELDTPSTRRRDIAHTPLAKIAALNVNPWAGQLSKLAAIASNPWLDQASKIAATTTIPWAGQLSPLAASAVRFQSRELAELTRLTNKAAAVRAMFAPHASLAASVANLWAGQLSPLAASAVRFQSREQAELTRLTNKAAAVRAMFAPHASISNLATTAISPSWSAGSLLGGVNTTAMAVRLLGEINSPGMVKAALGSFGTDAWRERILGDLSPAMFSGSAVGDGTLSTVFEGLATFAFPQGTYASMAFPAGTFAPLSGLKVDPDIDRSSVLPKGASSRLADIVFPDGLFDLVAEIAQADAQLDRSLADQPGASGLIESTSALVEGLTEASGGRFHGKILTTNQAAKIMAGVLITSLAVLAWFGVPKQFQVVTDILSWPAALLGIWAALEARGK